MGVFFHKMDGSKAGPSSRSDRNIFESLLREDLSDSDDDFEIPHEDLRVLNLVLVLASPIMKIMILDLETLLVGVVH